MSDCIKTIMANPINLKDLRSAQACAVGNPTRRESDRITYYLLLIP
ncbi:MAG: hypothetical protein F6J90_28975 [Moorea sp. SIOASIH]|nr:hypothetical protein [Moorena sp. SIOASIH]NEO40158.1 hypothetical protein [Moorena sp. SIOASIH]